MAPACSQYHVQDMACGRQSLASCKLYHGALPTWHVPQALLKQRESPVHGLRVVTLAVKQDLQLVCGRKPRVRAVRRGDDRDIVRVAVCSEGGPDHLPVRKERDELREPPGMQP